MRVKINFFIEEKKTHSNRKIFGLCDDDNDSPAYIDNDLSNINKKWIAEVYNELQKDVDFYPVDHCIELKRQDGSDAQRCEGILRYDDNNIVFTELKNRDSNWITKATGQIIETMTFFFDNYDSQSYKTKAWICNKSLTYQNYFQQISDFKEKTKDFCDNKRGFILHISKSLSI